MHKLKTKINDVTWSKKNKKVKASTFAWHKSVHRTHEKNWKWLRFYLMELIYMNIFISYKINLPLLWLGLGLWWHQANIWMVPKIFTGNRLRPIRFTLHCHTKNIQLNEINPICSPEYVNIKHRTNETVVHYAEYRAYVWIELYFYLSLFCSLFNSH